MRAAIFSFTENGHALGESLKAAFSEARHYTSYNEKPLKELVMAELCGSGCLVFIGAAGIAVRAVAPFIKAKDTDPAVIVIDDMGRYVIPILSGHLGGANELAELIGNTISAQPVITTATDINGKFSVDVWAKKSGLVVINLGGIKAVSAAVLRGERVGLCCDYPIDGRLPDFICLLNGSVLASSTAAIGEKTPAAGIVISEDAGKKPFENTLTLTPAAYALGVGCKRGADPETLRLAVKTFLTQNNIDERLLFGVASIDIKKDEPAINELCRALRLTLSTFKSGELAELRGEFSASSFVKKTVLVDNVCERSAVKLSGGALVARKTVIEHVALALAKKEWRCNFCTFQ